MAGRAHRSYEPTFPPRAGSSRQQWRGVIEEYRGRLPVGADTPVVTLREGGTPLIHSCELSGLTGCEVWLKFEGANPTGSFKDRGMTVAISKAVEAGAQAVICASPGITSASAAAYAAKARLVCGVLIPKGKIALGKLAQALVHGAKVIQVDGNFDRALEICRTLHDTYPVELVNSVNPYRIQGQKTGAFEVCDFLGRAPDVHVMPVGNAGNITAYWAGYREYRQDGLADRLPVMHGFQAAGAAPIVRGRVIESPSTIATAIRIGNPASWKQAVAAADESGGSVRAVTDRDILKAYRRLAAEGVFAEMASAASVAGLLHLRDTGDLTPGQTVVCVLTGHGLKDPDWAIAGAAQPPVVPPDVDAAAELLGLT
ncbi:MAG: threonine synthase, partial [Actinomycetota bacterium]|nr:threonine synthase [Actinomycetota bacterium]